MRVGLDRPLVGLVVIGYNELPLLRVCFGSLRKLDYPNVQVIYVDNMSSDGSIDAIACEFPEVKLIESGSNAGYCGGNNVGIRCALSSGCEYILLLNPDTELCNPSFLCTLIDHMESNPEVGKCAPRIFLRKIGRVQNTILRFPFLHRRVAAWFKYRMGGKKTSACQTLDSPHECESLNGCCVLVKRDALMTAGGLDEVMWCYSDEVEWDLRLARAGWKRVFIPVDSIIHHQKLAGYDLTGRASLMQSRNGAYFFRKNHLWCSMFVWVCCKIVAATSRMLMAPLRRESLLEHFDYLKRLSVSLWLVVVGDFAADSFGFGSEAAKRRGSPHSVTTSSSLGR